ncbi:MAG: exodeoxyribonuclease VII small subunit [Candidatus Omnitrophota bacterium]
MAEQSFEKSLERLEKIVAELEGGDLPLDEALKRYEEGIKLVQGCSKKIESAQKKVELLTKTSGGKFQLKAFDDGEEK